MLISGCKSNRIWIGARNKERTQQQLDFTTPQQHYCTKHSTKHHLGIPVVYGDASLTATLKAAHINQALALIAVTSKDTTNLEIALNAKGLSLKIPAIVRYEDPHLAKMAQQVFEFESVLSPSELAAPAFAAAALGEKILGNGMTGDSLWVALATLITPAHPFCNRSVKWLTINNYTQPY